MATVEDIVSPRGLSNQNRWIDTSSERSFCGAQDDLQRPFHSSSVVRTAAWQVRIKETSLLPHNSRWQPCLMDATGSPRPHKSNPPLQLMSSARELVRYLQKVWRSLHRDSQCPTVASVFIPGSVIIGSELIYRSSAPVTDSSSFSSEKVLRN